MTRRALLALLAAGAAGAAALAAGGSWLWRRGSRPTEDEAARGSRAMLGDEDRKVLRAVADVIVPREGPHPAAGETPLLEAFEARLAVTPQAQGLERFRRELAAFGQTLRARVPSPGGQPDPELLGRWCEGLYREMREQSAPSREAVFFEQIRREILHAYYAGPAGWQSLGWEGPVHWTAEQLAAASAS